MSTSDIYADLTSTDLGEKITKLQARNASLVAQLIKCTSDVQKLCDELQRMKNTESNLKTNISELYKSSKLEIERKDRQIAELQSKIDDLVFKRYNFNNQAVIKPIKTEITVEQLPKKLATSDSKIIQRQNSKSRSKSPKIDDLVFKRYNFTSEAAIKRVKTEITIEQPPKKLATSDFKIIQRQNSKSRSKSPRRRSLSTHRQRDAPHHYSRSKSRDYCGRYKSNNQLKKDLYVEHGLRRIINEKIEVINYKTHRSKSGERADRDRSKQSVEHFSKSLDKNSRNDTSTYLSVRARWKDKPDDSSRLCSAENGKENRCNKYSAKSDSDEKVLINNNNKVENVSVSTAHTEQKQYSEHTNKCIVQNKAEQMVATTDNKLFVPTSGSPPRNGLSNTTPTVIVGNNGTKEIEFTARKRRRCIIQLN